MVSKKNKVLLIVLIAVLVVGLCVGALLFLRGCQSDTPPAEDPSVGEPQTYTVQVKTAGGVTLSGVGVYIYEDETMTELVWYDQTGEDGCMTFTDLPRNSYVVVLADVPTGYAVEGFYPITGERTEIILQAGVLNEDEMEQIRYKLGDLMMDFTVTGPDGTEYTLSELLAEKEAVVLNFWFIECQPCKAEFPYLQEAYDQYSDKIALIAMNPINAEEDIAAFQKENGYTFPMVSCDSKWQEMMGVYAYPTTVIIDRYGNISLVHTGSIDSTKVFTDAFQFFTAEEYEPTVVQDIMDLETESEEGTAENPIEVGGQASFEVTVEPGQVTYVEVYRATGMYLQVTGSNGEFYVECDDKTYKPESGKVGFVVTSGDNYTPTLLAIGNNSAEKQTYTVKLSHMPGTFNNPHKLNLGEFTAKVNAGNSQGVYYKCTAPEDGTYTIQCISAPAGVEFGFFLQSLDINRTVLRNFEGIGPVSEAEGYPTVTMQMKGGKGMLFSVGTLPDDTNSYPSGSFVFVLSFEPGEVEDAAKIEKLDYTVTVTDQDDLPLADVTVWLTKDSETFSAKTDENGLATLNLEKGTYAGSVSIPEGYTLEQNAFELTEEAPAATVKLTAAEDTKVDYLIYVTDAAGVPVEGAEVLILGAGSSLTDAEGKVTFNLEAGNYSVLTGTLPQGFSCSQMLNLDAENLTGTIVLDSEPGTELNPIVLNEAENTVTNAGTVYYAAYQNGSTMYVSGNADFKVLVDGQELSPTDGVVSVPVNTSNPRMPMNFAIVGDGEYNIKFVYPAGHPMNPAQLVLGQNTASLEAGASDYYYNWTAIGDGELTITVDTETQWLYCITNLTTGASGDIHWCDDDPLVRSETVKVSKGDVIQLTVNTYDPANMWATPAGDVTVTASFVWVVEEAPFTTETIQANTNYTYKVYGINGATLTIEDEDAYVIYGGTTYGADANGVVTVTFGTEDPAILVIGNSGTEDESYAVNFSWPAGSRRNPTKLTFRASQNVNTNLAAGDADGHYYLLESTSIGTLTFKRRSSTADYTITVIRNNGEETAVPAADDTTKTVEMYVVPGDQILIHVQAVPGEDGTYPAARVMTLLTFTQDYNIYTVTFDPNGGTLTGEASAETVNGKLSALPADPVRADWRFLGWFDAAIGGNQVAAGAVIKENTTIYAQWEKIEYTVTFNPNGGYVDGEETAVTTDYKLAELPVAIMDGYIFNGWFDLPVGGNQITADHVYTDHATVYAQWISDGSNPEGETITYQVTVLDGNGDPATGGIYVTWQSADTVMTAVVGNDGVATAQLPANGYTVVLTLTGSYASYRYDTANTVATAAAPAITVQIAQPISSDATETEYSSGNSALVTKDVTLGATYVVLNSSQSNYAVVDGTGYCFFRILIEEEGRYGFTTSNGAPITTWGTNTSFIQNGSTEQERENNKFELELKESNFSSDAHVVALIFAVEVTDRYTSTILQAEYLGEAEYTYMDAPFAEYEGTETPEVEYVDGEAVAIDENIFKLDTQGKTLTYVDMLLDVAVKGEDGFYHLNTEDGPILYVNLGENAPYISMGTMVGAIGEYGTGFKKTFFNEDGTPEMNADGTYHKEDYTAAMVAYALHADPTTGVYPLTDDLIYMIQNGGEDKGWYTPGSGAYLFEEMDITVNPELIWMFAVCYLK